MISIHHSFLSQSPRGLSLTTFDGRVNANVFANFRKQLITKMDREVFPILLIGGGELGENFILVTRWVSSSASTLPISRPVNYRQSFFASRQSAHIRSRALTCP